MTKRAYNARWEDQIHWMLDDLSKLWHCSLTEAGARAIAQVHAATTGKGTQVPEFGARAQSASTTTPEPQSFTTRQEPERIEVSEDSPLKKLFDQKQSPPKSYRQIEQERLEEVAAAERARRLAADKTDTTTEFDPQVVVDGDMSQV